MNVYYYGIFDNKAGLENFAKNLITSVVKKRPDIHYIILAVTDSIAFEDYLLSIGCKIIKLPNYRKKPFKFYRKVLSIFENRGKNDVAQINICSYRNVPLFMACKKSKINTVVVGHYTKVADKKHVWLHYFTRKVFSGLGVKVTNSDDVTNFMFEKNSNPYFICNGIDTSKFEFSSNNRQLIRHKYGVDDGVFLIGQIGRVATDKNQIFSLKVIKGILEQSNRKNIRFFMIGKEVEPEARSLIEALHLNDVAIIIGESKEPIEWWYSALDVSLFPSINEGLSLSLLENIANGVPLIVSTNVPKVSVHSDCIDYLPLNEQAWIACVNKYMFDYSRKPENVLANTMYDANVFCDKYIDVYDNYSHYIKMNS